MSHFVLLIRFTATFNNNSCHRTFYFQYFYMSNFFVIVLLSLRTEFPQENKPSPRFNIVYLNSFTFTILVCMACLLCMETMLISESYIVQRVIRTYSKWLQSPIYVLYSCSRILALSLSLTSLHLFMDRYKLPYFSSS